MSTKRTLTCIAVAALATAGSVASAENGLVVVRGGAAEHERNTVSLHIETVTRDDGWLLPTSPLRKQELDAVLTCAESTTPWACLPDRGARYRQVFVIGVEDDVSPTGAPMVVITAKLIVGPTKSSIVRQRFCTRCADDELGRASAELARNILREAAVLTGRTVARITSKPDGAAIILDGNPVGATDATFNVYPGRHRVRIEKPGFVAHDAEFTVEAGKTADVAVELQPSRTGSPPSIGESSRTWPIVVLAAGGALVVTGVVLLALDDDVSSGGPQPEKFDNTAAYGVTYMAAGAVVAAAGGYWLWRRSNARSAPTASLVPGGGVVGWFGTF